MLVESYLIQSALYTYCHCVIRRRGTRLLSQLNPSQGIHDSLPSASHLRHLLRSLGISFVFSQNHTNLSYVVYIF